MTSICELTEEYFSTCNTKNKNTKNVPKSVVDKRWRILNLKKEKVAFALKRNLTVYM